MKLNRMIEVVVDGCDFVEDGVNAGVVICSKLIAAEKLAMIIETHIGIPGNVHEALTEYRNVGIEK